MSKENSVSIKNWAEDDRPREKMLLKGKEALSNAELLAVLIGSGNKQLSALELAQNLLHDNKNQFTQISKLTPKELMKTKGIGIAKAVSIAASFEIARRRTAETTNINNLNNSSSVAKYLEPYLKDKTHEEFYIICMNTVNNPISINKIGEGGFDKTLVDIKKIFNIAIVNKANKIILAHNHTANSLGPSKEDLFLTNKIQDAGKILDITIIDHLIITDHDYYSFADNNLIKN